MQGRCLDRKLNGLLFSERYLTFKKLSAFMAIFFLMAFSHYYSPGMVIKDKAIGKEWLSFTTCKVLKIVPGHILIKDDDADEKFLIELAGPFEGIEVSEGDKISFIGMMTGRKENGLAVLNIVKDYYNHRYNTLKRYISIPPVLIILFFLFRDRKRHFGK